jgi:hypothetical protein
VSECECRRAEPPLLKSDNSETWGSPGVDRDFLLAERDSTENHAEAFERKKMIDNVNTLMLMYV